MLQELLNGNCTATISSVCHRYYQAQYTDLEFEGILVRPSCECISSVWSLCIEYCGSGENRFDFVQDLQQLRSVSLALKSITTISFAPRMEEEEEGEVGGEWLRIRTL